MILLKKGNLPRLVIFATGGKTGGGSGFQKLVEATRAGELRAEIVAVVSNHPKGGVHDRAKKLGVPFVYFPGPFDVEHYQQGVRDLKADFVALSGWLKLVKGLDPRTTFNIHPGPLPRFGGPGFYGHHVHEAVLAAYKKGQITHSEVSMHFVTDPTSPEDYDKGPVFFRFPVPLDMHDTADSIAQRVNAVEHEYQPQITDLVVQGHITWDGVDPDSLVVPAGYTYHRPTR